VLGWDATGVVEAVGAKVTRFKLGDRVWYAGDLNRAGSNAERQTVDEHIVGTMPASIDFAEAAALPLTAITAWELLFDRLRVQDADPTANNRLLVIGAGGGVGSILVQLARKFTGLTVIATASRSLASIAEVRTLLRSWMYYVPKAGWPLSTIPRYWTSRRSRASLCQSIGS